MDHFSRLDASSFGAVAGFLEAAACVKIFTTARGPSLLLVDELAACREVFVDTASHEKFSRHRFAVRQELHARDHFSRLDLVDGLRFT
jgi:hypothetical protein